MSSALQTAFLYDIREPCLQPLMVGAVTVQIGSPGTGAPRPGPRSATATRLSPVPRAIPQLRQGTGVPEVLGPRRRSAQALTAGVPDAPGLGVSPRNVDASARPWEPRESAGRRSRRAVRAGMNGPRSCAPAPSRRSTRLPGSIPRSLTVRDADRVLDLALVGPRGANADGGGEGLGGDGGPSEEIAPRSAGFVVSPPVVQVAETPVSRTLPTLARFLPDEVASLPALPGFTRDTTLRRYGFRFVVAWTRERYMARSPPERPDPTVRGHDLDGWPYPAYRGGEDACDPRRCVDVTSSRCGLETPAAPVHPPARGVSGPGSAPDAPPTDGQPQPLGALGRRRAP